MPLWLKSLDPLAMPQSRQRSSLGKKAPRKKTGCLVCRARHTKCDEKLPACSACARSGLRCERSGPIVFEPHRSNKKQVPEAIGSKATVRALEVAGSSSSVDAYLLRRFQDGIATWIDLFDHHCRYQRLLMRHVSHSELLRSAICALAARQLALQQESSRWNREASEYYSVALRLQSEAMEAAPMSELLLPATLLLASYELMLLPGHDYSQHLLGAKAIVEAQFGSLQPNQLWVAAYWHFFRHDVSVALTNHREILLGQSHWLDRSLDADAEEDSLGNASLVLIAKALRWNHGPIDNLNDSTTYVKLQEDLTAWNNASFTKFSVFQSADSGVEWYATPAAPPAKQQALIADLLLRRGQRRRRSTSHNGIISDQQLGEEIIKISQSELSDAAQVQAVHYLCYVGRTVEDLPSKHHAIDIMRDLEKRTGFHTSSRISTMNE